VAKLPFSFLGALGVLVVNLVLLQKLQFQNRVNLHRIIRPPQLSMGLVEKGRSFDGHLDHGLLFLGFGGEFGFHHRTGLLDLAEERAFGADALGLGDLSDDRFPGIALNDQVVILVAGSGVAFAFVPGQHAFDVVNLEFIRGNPVLGLFSEIGPGIGPAAVPGVHDIDADGHRGGVDLGDVQVGPGLNGPAFLAVALGESGGKGKKEY